jgi:diazepam-binding inhibitor (GABA receptor modulating acyl-CoA-binding protein)
MVTKEEFEAAFERSKQLTRKPSNDILLKLYAHYKQATAGDVNTERPGGFDFVAIAKYNAWEALKGMDTQQAMNLYVELIKSLEAQEG